MLIFRNICDIVSFVGIKEIQTNDVDRQARTNVHVNYYGYNNPV